MTSSNEPNRPSEESPCPEPMGLVEDSPAGPAGATRLDTGWTGPAREWTWPSSRRRPPRTSSHRPVRVIGPHAVNSGLDSRPGR
jgi:hypothetical protein